MYPRTYACSPEEFLAASRLPTRVMEDEAAMMEDIAQTMFEACLLYTSTIAAMRKEGAVEGFHRVEQALQAKKY